MVQNTTDVIYSNGDVMVSSSLVKIAGVSYPVNGIGSVLVSDGELGPLRIFFGILTTGFGLYVFLPGIRSEYNPLLLMTVGLGMVAWGWKKPNALVLRTASGDRSVLVSRDFDMLHKVKAAIEAAVVHRGYLIRTSRASYRSPCGCPFDTDRAGRSCGRRSAHERPGGAVVHCSPADVSPTMIASYRAARL
jgi:hypothetical protein